MLTSENRTRDAHEPSGEPESLWGKMRGKMGDRVQYGRPDGADDRKKKKEDAAKKKRQQVGRAGGAQGVGVPEGQLQGGGQGAGTRTRICSAPACCM